MKGKNKILLVGGAGFTGINLAEEFAGSKKYELVVLDSREGAQRLMPKGTKVFRGSFLQPKILEAIFRKHRIRTVFHLACTTTPGVSNTRMVQDIKENVIGTVRLLDAMREHKVPKIVFFSSGGAVYGHGDSRQINEVAPTNPLSSYGIGKLALEKYVQLYHRLSGLEYLILRTCNPYGPHHTSATQGFINIALKKVLRKQPVAVWGDGSAVKDYIYVKDYAAIVRMLLERNIANEIFNIGTGRGYSVNEILRVLRKVAGPFTVEYQDARAVDAPKITLDVRKLKSVVDIEFTPLETGVRHTYNWLKDSHEC